MKICIIGNSHVGSLKRAWEPMTHLHDTHEIVFFADRGRGLNEIDISGDVLAPKTKRLQKSLEFTSGGRKFIDPKEYDFFLVYGLNSTAFFIHPKKHYSSAVLEQSTVDHVSASLSIKVVELLRALTNKKIYIGHTPLLACKALDFKVTFPAGYLCGLDIINENVYSKINAKMLQQPLDTIVNGRFTHPNLSTGSKRLSIGDKRDDEHHPENDHGHMNDEFGAKWLSSFLEEISLQ
ncbi:hypothetical protein [Vreelandella titanicae]|uniref:hypothetical protein n=1 Tax=Vreelandella titanicae TaxID=664683 RepID=UPI0011444FFA|nr:hypothetical protein [Halomonas titanicae]